MAGWTPFSETAEQAAALARQRLDDDLTAARLRHRPSGPKRRCRRVSPDEGANAVLDLYVLALLRSGRFEDADYARLHFQGKGVAGERAYVVWLQQQHQGGTR